MTLPISFSQLALEIVKPKKKPDCNVCMTRCKDVFKTDYLKSISQKIYFCSKICFDIHSKYVTDDNVNFFTCFKELPQKEKE